MMLCLSALTNCNLSSYDFTSRVIYQELPVSLLLHFLLVLSSHSLTANTHTRKHTLTYKYKTQALQSRLLQRIWNWPFKIHSTKSHTHRSPVFHCFHMVSTSLFSHLLTLFVWMHYIAADLVNRQVKAAVVRFFVVCGGCCCGFHLVPFYPVLGKC